MPSPLRIARSYFRGRSAAKYASARNAPGMAFDSFGRSLGRRLLMKGRRAGMEYLLTPIATVRYWEYPFTLSCLPPGGGKFLDVSSPRLFSLYVATTNPRADVLMMNPDAADAARTQSIARAIGLTNFRVTGDDASRLETMRGEFDCAWSISVIEHIDGAYDDRSAVKYLYDALRPGGRLILTVPTDRRYEIEYRDRDYYGTQPPAGASRDDSGRYFFCRIYDKAAIQSRLLDPIGRAADVTRWFGETTPGVFKDHVRRWLAHGAEVPVNDPREIADHYREFDRWEDMPGYGVCGLMVTKPG
jgi:SAM-dependent methyltransferase